MDVNFLIESHQKINNQPKNNGSKKKPSRLPLRNRRAAWIRVVFRGGMVVG